MLCFQLHFTTREHCFGFCNLKAGEAHVPLLSEEGFDRLRMSAYLSVRFWRVNSLKCQLGCPHDFLVTKKFIPHDLRDKKE